MEKTHSYEGRQIIFTIKIPKRGVFEAKHIKVYVISDFFGVVIRNCVTLKKLKMHKTRGVEKMFCCPLEKKTTMHIKLKQELPENSKHLPNIRKMWKKQENNISNIYSCYVWKKSHSLWTDLRLFDFKRYKKKFYNISVFCCPVTRHSLTLLQNHINNSSNNRYNSHTLSHTYTHTHPHKHTKNLIIIFNVHFLFTVWWRVSE